MDNDFEVVWFDNEKKMNFIIKIGLFYLRDFKEYVFV